MSAISKPARMTAEEYFAFELTQEETWELVDGRPVRKWRPDPLTGMAGGTHAHHVIAMNLATSLRGLLRGGPCTPLLERKVQVPGQSFRYPDVVVDCGSTKMKDQAAAEPRVVFEVESPSTSGIDALERLEEFQSIASVQAIVILSQTEAKARLYVREGAGWRGETLQGLDAELPLASLGCALPFAEIYEGVELASP